MLATKELYSKIDQIVDHAYLGFLLMMLGSDSMTDEQKRQVEALGLIVGRKPLIELLYILMRGRPYAGYDPELTLNHLIDYVAQMGVLPIINDTHLATLDTGRASLLDAIETTKQEIKRQVRQQLIELNRLHRQDVAVKRIESASQVAGRKSDLKSKLLKLIPVILASAQDSFVRSFSSSLTDVINDIAVDNATAESLFTGVPPKDLVVYKKVINDASLCAWCRKFYRNPDGSPKLYTLAELQANGSNYGKPKREWKATIGKTHPRCRCELFHRPSHE